MIPTGKYAEIERGSAVTISAGVARLEGILVVPPDASGMVLFAHGSGSGRFSPRNGYVAGALQSAGLATLLLDLLTEAEAARHAMVFDIPLLAERLRVAAQWASTDSPGAGLALGYFGASTGAAAALVAATEAPPVGAIVSRGGRPDLAGAALDRVTAPTLLIVGGWDEAVIPLNKSALQRLRAPKELVIVSEATHLFVEPGKLEDVARLAAAWFTKHLAPASGTS
jgi:dienelactone hydrolase